MSYLNAPQYIRAESISYGDLIEVEHAPSGGLTTSYRGRARNRTTSGITNYWRTAEGAILIAWEAGVKPPRITLLDREPAPQTMLGVFT